MQVSTDPIFFKKGKLTVTQNCIFPSSNHQNAAKFLLGLKEQCLKGNVMIPLSVADQIQNGFSKNPEQFQSFQVLNTTKKCYGTKQKEQIVISPFLTSLSLEAILWIILSIANDQMTPSDRLIQSRIKEFYGLPVRLDDWQAFISYLAENIEAQSSKFHILRNWQIQKTILKDSEGQDTTRFEIYLKNRTWLIEDSPDAELRPGQERLYNEFLRFLEDFFESNEAEESIENWTSIMRNGRNKTERSNLGQLQKGMALREIKKGIPGGKYGCCQFIKHCGPEELQSLSIGTLKKFIQLALSEGKVAYYKTILVRNSSKSFEGQSVLEEERETGEIKSQAELVRTLIVDLLKNPKHRASGVKLSVIPHEIQKEFGYQIETANLGVSKLKDFLKGIPEISFSKQKPNIVIVSLKGSMEFSTTLMKRFSKNEREVPFSSNLLSEIATKDQDSVSSSQMTFEAIPNRKLHGKCLKQFIQGLLNQMVIGLVEFGNHDHISAESFFELVSRDFGFLALSISLDQEKLPRNSKGLWDFVQKNFGTILAFSINQDHFKLKFFHSDSVFFSVFNDSSTEDILPKGKHSEPDQSESDDENNSTIASFGNIKETRSEGYLPICYEVAEAIICS